MPARLAIGTVPLSAGAPKIVAAGGAAEVDALATADGADLVELRADLWDDPSPAALPGLLKRLRGAGRPVILTVRAAAEGGRPLEEEARRALYTAGLPHADALDLEIASAALVGELVPQARAAGRTVILSAHALDATPPAAALLALVDRAVALGADVTKLVTHARDLLELRTLVAVTVAAADRGIVTLALGPAGPLSRVVLPAAGSLLTYAHVGRPTAPSGQLALAELVPLLRRLLPV
jgi:3-dehydroquinate dehydratase-1